MYFKRIIVGVGVPLAALVALSGAGCAPETAQSQGQEQTEQAFEQQSKAVPYPLDQLKDSTERRNVKERLLRTNKPDIQGYVYPFNAGSNKAIGYYTVKGKVRTSVKRYT